MLEPYLPSFKLVDHGLLHFMSDEALLAEAVIQTLHLPPSDLEFFIVWCEYHPQSMAGIEYLDMLRWSKRGVM